jgi:hypothetical protein
MWRQRYEGNPAAACAHLSALVHSVFSTNLSECWIMDTDRWPSGHEGWLHSRWHTREQADSPTHEKRLTEGLKYKFDVTHGEDYACQRGVEQHLNDKGEETWPGPSPDRAWRPGDSETPPWSLPPTRATPPPEHNRHAGH